MRDSPEWQTRDPFWREDGVSRHLTVFLISQSRSPIRMIKRT